MHGRTLTSHHLSIIQVRLSTLTSEFTFKCVVRNSRGDLFAEEYGHGSNKKEAEKDAAANMLPRVEEIFKKRETSPQLQCVSWLMHGLSTLMLCN